MSANLQKPKPDPLNLPDVKPPKGIPGGTTMPSRKPKPDDKDRG